MSARLRAWFHAAPVTVASSEAEAADGDLVRRFADTHDEAAFAELVRRHGPMVLATCRRVLHPDIHTADDAFQATFLVLATKAAAVSPPERVGAWLHGVAVHVAKKAKAWVRKIAPSAPSDLDKVPAALVEADPDAADVRAKLDDVLAGLPSKYRSAVVLCELEGRSRAEAAAALGWSEGTLSSRLARARKLLADRLARRGVVLPAAGLGVVLPASAALATVPAQLAASTVRTATLVAAGAATGEAIPASVAALAQGVPPCTPPPSNCSPPSVALVGSRAGRLRRLRAHRRGPARTAGQAAHGGRAGAARVRAALGREAHLHAPGRDYCRRVRAGPGRDRRQDRACSSSGTRRPVRKRRRCSISPSSSTLTSRSAISVLRGRNEVARRDRGREDD